nr:hypothetical protein [Tanacetum cinerariifolium]
MRNIFIVGIAGRAQQGVNLNTPSQQIHLRRQTVKKHSPSENVDFNWNLLDPTSSNVGFRKKKSTIKRQTSLTHKSPSPFKSQYHLSQEFDRITNLNFSKSCSNWEDSIPPLTGRRKEDSTESCNFSATQMSLKSSSAYRRGNKWLNWVSPTHISLQNRKTDKKTEVAKEGHGQQI